MRSTSGVVGAMGLICAFATSGCGDAGGGRGDGGADEGIGTASLTGAGTGDDDGTGADDDGASGQGVTADEGGEGADGDAAKFDLGAQPDVALGCGEGGGGGGGGGGPDFSYIWIANSNESTVSKINTETLVEEGRYLTRPDGAGNPSRTSVNLNGDMAIANRAGGVTMIYARHVDCPDATNTSSGPGDVKAWPDGCMGWHTPMAYSTQRPVAWTAGDYNESTCRYDNVKLWTSGANATMDVLLLDGETGVIEQTVPIPIVPDGYGMYGGAVDSGDNFWGTQLGGGQLVRVDRQAFGVQMWQTPAGGYGIAVDRNDRVWTCSGQVGRFDYASQTWQTAQAGGSGGCMGDGGDLLWLANDPLVAVDIDTLAVVQTIDLPAYVHGVSVDFNGYVWGPAIYNNEAYRVDPATGQIDTVTGLNFPYTYSDMTGFGLSQVGAPTG